MKFTFPCPPTLNHLYGVTKTGRRYKKPAHTLYMNQVQSILITGKIKPIAKNEVGVEIVWYRQKGVRDIDNIQKTLFDAVKPQKIKVGRKTVGFTQWGIFKDDSQIAELHIYRRPVKSNPRIEFVCYEI